MSTATLPLNDGLVAIIGARGSGKTALTDLIACGGLAEGMHKNPRSFVARAQEFLTITVVELTWANGETTGKNLWEQEENIWDTPRLQYLSQQFVDELCSTEGPSDSLMDEMHKVVFNSHSVTEREGATSFHELSSIRCSDALLKRQRSEDALAEVASHALKASEITGGRPKLVVEKGELEKERGRELIRLLKMDDSEEKGR